MMRTEDLPPIKGTVITRETATTPSAPSDCEYPFPDDANQQLFSQYQQLARQDANLVVCGRLGEYRYFDMDQAIARAMLIAQKILVGTSSKEVVGD